MMSEKREIGGNREYLGFLYANSKRTVKVTVQCLFIQFSSNNRYIGKIH